MPDSKVNTEDLGAYIPRPKKVSEKRKMLAVYKDDYDQISGLFNTWRQLSVKKCAKCGALKPLDEFHKRKISLDGLALKCKVCQKEYSKQHYEANKTTYSDKSKKYYAKNSSVIKAKSKQWAIDNPEQLAKTKVEYNKNNKAVISAKGKKYYAENKEACAARSKRYRENNVKKLQKYGRKYRKENIEKLTLLSKIHRENNKEEISIKNKLYREENTFRINRKRRAYRKNNPEKLKAQGRHWSENNRDRIRVSNALYRLNNKEKLATMDKEYRLKNLDKVKKVSKAYYIKNRDKILADQKITRYINPKLREKAAIANRIWRANNKAKVREYGATYRASKLQACPIWAKTPAAIEARVKMRAEQQRKTAKTGKMHHIDHVIPLRGVDVSGLHCIDNLRITRLRNNVSKQNSFDQEGESERQLEITLAKLAS